MKKKQILISLVVLIGAGMATGCKNQSKSLEAPNPTPIVKPDLKKESSFEKAVRAKEELTKAIEEAVAVKKEYTEAIKDRDELKDALDGDLNSQNRLEVSKNLGVAMQAVSNLEEKVKLYEGKIKDKRALLNVELAKLTDDEKSKIGEGTDVEYEAALNAIELEEARLARVKMSYEAAKESVLNLKNILDGIEVQIAEREAKLLAFSVPGETASLKPIQDEIASLRSLYSSLMGQLNIQMATQDTLASALKDLQ